MMHTSSNRELTQSVACHVSLRLATRARGLKRRLTSRSVASAHVSWRHAYVGVTAALLHSLQQMHILPSGPKMCLSYGSSERSGSGNHAHVRSFSGSLPGWRFCIQLTTQMKRP